MGEDEDPRDLFSAFWVHIIEVLRGGDEETHLWLDTGHEVSGFLWWCEVSHKDPKRYRNLLKRIYEMAPED